MSAILTINDNHLLIQQEGSVSSSQGYALLLNDKVVFDLDDQDSAIKSCRMQPQQLQNRYWQQCAQTSIGVNNSSVRNSADLIWQHLTAMRNKFALDKVVFVVPSHFQQENLQLLLGIANSSGLSTQGLINKAVLVTQYYARQDGDYLHVDMQLHQTVSSLVTVRQGIATLSDIDIVSDVSIQLIQDALLREMQQSFIQNNRFDPLHYAETEQQLFDQISDVALTISTQGKASIAVKRDTHVHSITMDSAQWNSVIEPFASKVLAQTQRDQPSQILMQLNKLFDGVVPPSFNQKNVQLVDDLLRIESTLVDQGGDSEDGLTYTIELPLLNSNENSKDKIVESSKGDISPNTNKLVNGSRLASNQDSVESEQQVTHLMQAGLAVPLAHAHINIDSGQLQLRRSQESNILTLFDKQQLFVISDEQRRTLKLNDRLGSNYADGVINAIQVLE